MTLIMILMTIVMIIIIIIMISMMMVIRCTFLLLMMITTIMCTTYNGPQLIKCAPIKQAERWLLLEGGAQPLFRHSISWYKQQIMMITLIRIMVIDTQHYFVSHPDSFKTLWNHFKNYFSSPIQSDDTYKQQIMMIMLIRIMIIDTQYYFVSHPDKN